MLLRFRFANYRSFRAEQELSMVASTALADSTESLIRTPAIPDGVLPVATLYGANASGKSNVLRAFEFMVDAVQDSFRLWSPNAEIPHDPFALGRDQPSRFEVDFLIEGVRYQYGFAANGTAIREEWLSAFPSGRRQEWFRRGAGRKIKFSRMLGGDNLRVEAMTRPNCLFLSAAAQANHPKLAQVCRWFWLPLVRTEPSRQVLEWRANAPHTAPMLSLLGAADLGIQRVSLMEGTDPTELWFEHTGSGKRFSLGQRDESLGTLSYMSLVADVSKALAERRILLVDELDQSLHPALAKQLIAMFGSRESNPKGAQLIFNTHDTNLLSSGLRRDQIWFTEKNRTGESTLYPLTDFKPRKGENIEKGYLQGRYGAIPFLNSQAFLSALEHRTNGDTGEKKKSARKR
ncbi:MAG: ATP-binding protein [Bryobacteraceae bacterium]